jgi:integrase/recombinase XerC
LSAISPLPLDTDAVMIVLMLTPSRAVDLFLGDLNRRSRSKTGRTAASYRRLLDKFTDQLERHGDIDVTEITPDDCRRFLDGYARRAVGYQATIHATLNSYLEWLYQQQRIKRNPLDHVRRPRRISPLDLDVLEVPTEGVAGLLAAATTEAELLAVSVLAYLGPRRSAVASLRLSDYDRERGLLRFREKGTKTPRKPVPDELRAVLDAAIDRGALVNEWQPPDPYLIPPEGPLLRTDDRDDRVIWRLVKAVAARAGVPAHVHALRAAFACFYLENGGDLIGLQELLGHDSIETTRLYARKLDRRRAMEPVRSLSWAAVSVGNTSGAESSLFAGVGFTVPAGMGAGGFEPPSLESALLERARSERDADDASVEPREPAESS